MRTPTTALDSRFSEPGASPTPWEDTVRVLEAGQLFWLTTVRVDGRPHVTPLVAVWLDGAIHFSTGVDEQKAHNLGANPHVILTTGCSDWEQGLDVVVEGTATLTTDHATLQRLADAWRTKWDGQWDYDVHNGAFRGRTASGGGAAGAGREAVVYSVVPTKILAFSKGTFTQTRYRPSPNAR